MKIRPLLGPRKLGGSLSSLVWPSVPIEQGLGTLIMCIRSYGMATHNLHLVIIVGGFLEVAFPGLGSGAFMPIEGAPTKGPRNGLLAMAFF